VAQSHVLVFPDGDKSAYNRLLHASTSLLAARRFVSAPSCSAVVEEDDNSQAGSEGQLPVGRDILEHLGLNPGDKHSEAEAG